MSLAIEASIARTEQTSTLHIVAEPISPIIQPFQEPRIIPKARFEGLIESYMGGYCPLTRAEAEKKARIELGDNNYIIDVSEFSTKASESKPIEIFSSKNTIPEALIA
ncbi:hypothetical protein M1349_04000 [Patescibacteria group bacterium]|nr:hypothetical protein [Patescibacteria group bacterium]